MQFSELRAQAGQAKHSKSKSAGAAAGTSTITHCFEKDRKYGRGSREHKFLTDAVTHCIATDMLPISIVDNHGFCELVSKLNPRYDIPYKDHFSRLAIPSLYETTKECIQHKMATEMENFSATADWWSSCTSEPYLCLTVHYVDSTWKLTSHCLQAHYTPRRPYWRKPSRCPIKHHPSGVEY